MGYANCELEPMDGDVVEWISNGERWTVCGADDLTGPSPLCHWPDGGWCNVNLIYRPTTGGDEDGQ